MDTGWIKSARALFVLVYGEKRGAAVCNVVMPAVMGDFRRMLAGAGPGETITERYRTEDRKTDVIITGRREDRNGSGVCVIERIEIGGRPADLGGGLEF